MCRGEPSCQPPSEAPWQRGSGSGRTGGTTKTGGRKKAVKRELIDTGTDKRYVRPGAAGKFKESDDVGKTLTADRRQKAKTKVKNGQVDKGRSLGVLLFLQSVWLPGLHRHQHRALSLVILLMRGCSSGNQFCDDMPAAKSVAGGPIVVGGTHFPTRNG